MGVFGPAPGFMRASAFAVLDIVTVSILFPLFVPDNGLVAFMAQVGRTFARAGSIRMPVSLGQINGMFAGPATAQIILVPTDRDLATAPARFALHRHLGIKSVM